MKTACIIVMIFFCPNDVVYTVDSVDGKVRSIVEKKIFLSLLRRPGCFRSVLSRVDYVLAARGIYCTLMTAVLAESNL